MTRTYFTPDSRTLVTSRGDEYGFWDVRSWQRVRRLPWETHSYPGWVAFSPDQTLLALERHPAVIDLIEAASGRTLARLEDPRTDRTQWLGFTPNGAQLVAISKYAKAIHVWDLRAIREQLASIDLDTESPRNASAAKPETGPPLVVEVLLGDSTAPEKIAQATARRGIETYRRAVEDQPESPGACNNLAWAYLTALEHLRDPSRALDLALKASRLAPDDLTIRNTLGVAYYRCGRYREAADTLRANLSGQSETSLPWDLYFLAMCHQRLGEAPLARTYFDWAERSNTMNDQLQIKELEEMAALRAEAKKLLGE